MEKRASILIADDNVSLCKTMSFALEHKGYAVTTASNGAQAIERALEKSFDIVFMDIKMPVMNGVETLKRLKSVRPAAIVMMMTAYSVEDLVQEALREGAYGILYKPVDIEKVVAIIDESKISCMLSCALAIASSPV